MRRGSASGDVPGTAGPMVSFDGRPIPSVAGDTVGACFLRARVVALRTSRTGEPRGLYCAIGVCNDCLVTVDDVPNVRACITPIVDGMAVRSQGGPPNLRLPGTER